MTQSGPRCPCSRKKRRQRRIAGTSAAALPRTCTFATSKLRAAPALSTREYQSRLRGLMAPPINTVTAGKRRFTAAFVALSMCAYCSAVPSNAHAPSGSFHTSIVRNTSGARATTRATYPPKRCGSVAAQIAWPSGQRSLHVEMWAGVPIITASTGSRYRRARPTISSTPRHCGSGASTVQTSKTSSSAMSSLMYRAPIAFASENIRSFCANGVQQLCTMEWAE